MKYFLLILILFVSPFSPIKLTLEDNFPIWLKDNTKHTEQTSGITFIGSKNDTKYFLLCDDIGKIHRIELRNNKIDIETIMFNKSVEKFLDKFDKKGLLLTYKS